MSIDSSQSTSSSRPTEQTQRSDAPKSDAPREPAPKENVDRFRQALQAKQEGRDEFLSARRQGAGELAGDQRAAAQAAARQAATEDAVAGIRQQADRDGSNPFQQAQVESAEMLAMMQAQNALRGGEAAQQQAPPPQVNAQAFAEMVERHVRQLAVGGGQAAGEEGQVLLRMADATLPGTDLLLSRTADGWLLRADVRSRGSYDAIREAAPELARRFAERNLGNLEIDPQYHG